MPYAAPPSIAESADDLRRQLHAERDPERKRRLHALVLMATGQAGTRAQVAEHLAVHRNTVTRWIERYRRGGLTGLLNVSKRGPAFGQRTVPAAVLTALQARLGQPSGFGGYDEVQRWLRDAYAVEVPYKSVYTLVRYRLKAKLKVPRPEHPKKV